MRSGARRSKQMGSLLLLELNALMCRDSVEYAGDDVSNATLDPAQVRQARELEPK